MGFLTGTSGTVTVQAKLTDYGKEMIHAQIDGTSMSDAIMAAMNPGEKLINAFAFGDSDIDYEAIDAADGGIPEVNHIPEASAFSPYVRSFALQSGTYRPGHPIVFIDGNSGPDPLSVTFRVPDNPPDSIEVGAYSITTEWPENSAYDDIFEASIESSEGSVIHNSTAKKAFEVVWVQPNSEFKIVYKRSQLSASQQQAIETVDTSSDVNVMIHGDTTNKTKTFKVQYQAGTGE